MYTTPIMLLHYLVKHKYPKTSNIYRWAEDLMVSDHQLNATVAAQST